MPFKSLKNKQKKRSGSGFKEILDAEIEKEKKKMLEIAFGRGEAEK